MKIIRLFLSCFMIILFHVNHLIADELNVQTFRSNLEKAHAQIFSLKGKYELHTTNINDSLSQPDTANTPHGLEMFAVYQYYENIVYFENYDKDFKYLISKALIRDGICKIINFIMDEKGLIHMRGYIRNIRNLTDVHFQPFSDTYLRLWGLLTICEKGGMDFIVTSVNYNNEECFLIEFPGTGIVPQLDGIDPRSLEPYYNPKTTRKVWVGKKNYNPLKYKYYDRRGRLEELIEIHYQEVQGYDVKNNYYIPKEIITEEYGYDTGKLERKIVAIFIGEWEVNRIYPKDTFTLEFPPGLTVYDARIQKTYVVE